MENILDTFRKQYEDYEIISLIGAETWQIRLKSYGKIAVLKRVDNPHIYKKLMPLKIKGIPVIYNIFEKEGKSYVIEEYISGSNLSEILSSKGSFNKKEVKSIVLKLCDILSKLHNEDIIHRDIKPSNIILTSSDEVYLIDFGIARAKNEGGTKDTKLLGTEFYASPEQYGFAQTDNRSDIYSLGKLMLVLLAGQETDENISKLPYYRVIKKCIEVDADNRFQSVSEIKFAVSVNKGVFIILFAVVLMLAFIAFKYSSDSKTGNEITETTTVETTQEETETEISIATETTTAITTETTTVKSDSIPSVGNESPQVSTNSSVKQPSEPVLTEKNEKSATSATKTDSAKKDTLQDNAAYKLGYSTIISHIDGKFDMLEKQGEKHLNEGVKLSYTLSANIYTEFSDSGLNIRLNDGNIINIPEQQNVTTNTYTNDMYIDKAYSIAYYDFNSDGIKDIFVSEAVCGRIKSKIDKYPLYYVNTFISINGDLTMNILSNDYSVIKDNELRYDIYNDRIDLSIGWEDSSLGKYVVENNKVYFKN